MAFTFFEAIVNASGFKTYKSKSADRESTDVVPNESLMEFYYTGKKVPYSNGTREHVWPCADSSGLWTHGGSTKGDWNVDLETYIGGGSDLYHVRPVDSKVNTARGDAAFVCFSDSEF